MNIEINPQGQSDLLQVTGSASLNGDLDVLADPGNYIKGTTYTFSADGGVTGTFSNVIISNPSIPIEVNYLTNEVQLGSYETWWAYTIINHLKAMQAG